jgi:hypothetical protein
LEISPALLFSLIILPNVFPLSVLLTKNTLHTPVSLVGHAVYTLRPEVANLIQGTGPNDKNETLGLVLKPPPQPLLQIAKYLSASPVWEPVNIAASQIAKKL